MHILKNINKINNGKYLLVEIKRLCTHIFSCKTFFKKLFQEGVTVPILAHIERYHPLIRVEEFIEFNKLWELFYR